MLESNPCPLGSPSGAVTAEAAESLTVRGTPAGSRPCATDAAATSSASTDVPFATSDAPGTDVTTTADVVVVSAGATSAVAGDKHTGKSGVHWSISLFEEILNKRTIVDRRFREHASTYSFSARRKPDTMAKFFVALLVLVAIYAAEAQHNPGHGHKGCFNGYDYDCCRN
ncbi:hypothetical protein LSAT2_016704 [Lamellibrachia satsuma]|nr:hypothetical protein LSAT2_016704 [Lamellibrachia satsuma]